MKDEYVYPNDFGMEPNRGLTKREYIAAQVLASMWSNLERASQLDAWGNDAATKWAETAVRAADALLEELKP